MTKRFLPAKSHAASLAVAAALSLLSLSCPTRAAGPDDPSADEIGGKAKPYIDRDDRVDDTAILPAPPTPGSAADKDDRDTFTATRHLEGTPRWMLATSDADRRPVSVLRDFSCAIGAAIDPSRAPALMTMLDRSYRDVEKSIKSVKALYHRARPLAGNEAPVCEPRSKHLETSYSFPSGHATQGWATALILADLVPDRSTAIMDRGRIYGESRVVCGAHWASDVAASRLAGSALFKALQSDPAFRSDLDRARQELVAARKEPSPTDPETCAREADAVAHPPQPRGP